MPIVTGIFVFLFFGGLTLLLQDPDFIKLKPTIINLVFSSILLGGLRFNKMFLKIAFQAFKLDDNTWKKLTLRWSFFYFFGCFKRDCLEKLYY